MKKTIQYLKVNPAGNITGFVLERVAPEDRKACTKAIIEQVDPDVEQVGFISFDDSGLPMRMDMMGGEFCANATRSYGLYVSQFLEGEEMAVEVLVSGFDVPLVVSVNKAASSAYVELPPAKYITQVRLQSATYMVVELDGIVHTIVDDQEEDRDFVENALAVVKEQIDSAAYGIMFLNPTTCEMVPYVYVVGSDTLYREGSCGSGTISAGYYLNKEKKDGFQAILKQPAGFLEVRAKKVGEQLRYSIGGVVEFGEMREITIDLE